MVITEAGADNPNVIGLVYVAAFAPDSGESAFQISALHPGSTLGEALTAYPVSTVRSPRRSSRRSPSVPRPMPPEPVRREPMAWR